MILSVHITYYLFEDHYILLFIWSHYLPVCCSGKGNINAIFCQFWFKIPAMAWSVPGQTMICDWSSVMRKCLVTSGGSLDKKMVCSLLASSADWPQHHALFSTLLHVCVQNWMTSPHNHVLQTDWRMQLELLSGELPESGEVGRGGRQSTGPGPQECGPCGRTGPQIFRGP
jgi:hypothetical protein